MLPADIDTCEESGALHVGIALHDKTQIQHGRIFGFDNSIPSADDDPRAQEHEWEMPDPRDMQAQQPLPRIGSRNDIGQLLRCIIREEYRQHVRRQSDRAAVKCHLKSVLTRAMEIGKSAKARSVVTTTTALRWAQDASAQLQPCFLWLSRQDDEDELCSEKSSTHAMPDRAQPTSRSLSPQL